MKILRRIDQTGGAASRGQRNRMARLVALAMIACGVPPALRPVQAANAGTAAKREENAQKISALSSPEREQLKQNLKRFRELSEAERQRLRLLHKQLEEDARGGGKLKQVLNNYYDWLKSLSPGQRADLRSETDVVRRRQQVADLLAKQQEALQQEAFDVNSPKKRRPELSQSDLRSLMAILERALREEGQLSDAMLEGKTGLPRYASVLNAAFPSGRRDPNPAWMRPELLDEMVSGISDEDQRKLFARDGDKRRRAGRLFLALFTSVLAEFRRQADEIDQAKLEKFFVEMKGEQQDEIMRVPYDSQSMRLKQMYMREHPNEFPQPPIPPPWLSQVFRMGGRGPGERPGFGPPPGFGPGEGPGGGGEGRPNREPPPEGGERGPRRPLGGQRPRQRDRQRPPGAPADPSPPGDS